MTAAARRSTNRDTRSVQHIFSIRIQAQPSIHIYTWLNGESKFAAMNIAPFALKSSEMSFSVNANRLALVGGPLSLGYC